MKNQNSSHIRRILIVDDDKIWRLLLSKILIEPSLHVELASDGIEALEIAREREIHVVVTDTNMPRMNGIELLRTLSAAKPELPVVLLFSGLMGSSLTHAEVAELGPAAILSKELVDSELKTLVMSLLETSSN